MNQLERIRRQHVKIMHHKMWCVMGPVVAMGRTEVRDDIPTACTDGVNKIYGEKFVAKLTDEELRFVILHEATHVAYTQLDVWRHLFEEDRKLANVAADLFVNLSLVDTDAGEGFIRMPEVGIPPDDKYRGWSVGKIYEDLKQNPPPDKGGNGSGDGQGFDEHDTSGAEGRSSSESQALVDEVGRLLRQGEIVRQQRSRDGAGKTPGVIDALLNPKVNWREALRDFIQELCGGREESSWRKVNRRYISNDVLMPSMVGYRMGELVVAIDTSGSCFGTGIMTRFVSELAGVIEQVNPERVRVLYWDTAVSGDQVFENGQFAVANVKPTGGGGTRVDVVFDYLREKRISPQAVVVLTDGDVGNEWGRSDWPTLWAVLGKNRAPYGVTLNIEE